MTRISGVFLTFVASNINYNIFKSLYMSLMTVQFNIEYKVMFGEQIVVNIQTREGVQKLPLQTIDGENGHANGVLKRQKSRIPIIIV